MPATDTAPQALTRLRQRGQLIEQYPLVCRLAATVPNAERGRLGLWLRTTTADEIIRRHPGLPVLRVAVTGNSTLGALVPHLVGNAAAAGLVADVRVGDFGQYREQLLTAGSGTDRFGPQLTLCVLDAYAVVDEIGVPWTADTVARTLDRKLAEIRTLVAAFTAHPDPGLLVLNTIPLPRVLAHQLIDYRSRAVLGAAWRRFNATLLDLGQQIPGVLCLDLEVLADDGPLAADPRLAVYARQRLPETAFAAYANEVVHLGRNLLGRTRKCLVLDLDGTLWGGILAEDGVAGIELGGDGEGAAFQYLQRVVKQLGSQGVLLAVCSKNDADEVGAALAGRPGMELRAEDFVAVAANWRPKPDNLAELAAALNLGTDSFVFVDDSDFECAFVRDRCMDIAVVHADGDPAGRVAALLADGWFTTRMLTDADRTRGESYRTEAERHTFLSGFSSLQDYLAALHLQVHLGPATRADLPRLAQLTQRTNQFNLSAERLDLNEVTARAEGAGTAAYSIAARDRFGEQGIVGAVFTSVADDGTTLVIDNFLLSCRVFSRGIESACLSELLRSAQRRGFRQVLARYRPTARNAKVAEFYPQHGFQPVAATATGTTYRHPLQAIPPAPEHITLLPTTHPGPNTTRIVAHAPEGATR